VLDRRPRDIQRIAFARAARAELGEFLRFASSQRLPCEELPDKALDRMVESTHHEGLVVVTRPRRWTPPKDLAEALATRRGVAIALDRVRNPHNVGAILRSAAFFGLQGVLLGTPAPHPGLPAAAVRVAEGGAERLLLSRTTDLADTLARLRTRGVRVIGADAQARLSAAQFAFERPLVLVLGNEREGLGDRIRAQCDGLVAIRGAGTLDSLNVAVAAGVLMGFATQPLKSK
jgi:TrmH RNA methyltransferase